MEETYSFYICWIEDTNGRIIERPTEILNRSKTQCLEWISTRLGNKKRGILQKTIAYKKQNG